MVIKAYSYMNSDFILTWLYLLIMTEVLNHILSWSNISLTWLVIYIELIIILSKLVFGQKTIFFFLILMVFHQLE